MTINSPGANRLASEINITPMIDVLLVLLIIFMVIVPATSLGERAVTPHNASTPPHPDAVVLEVLKTSTGDAAFKINRQTVSRIELPARLRAIYANCARPVLFVKGDDQLSFRQIAEVIDIGHAAGVDRVCLMTPKAAI